jgi:putative nucleotidyltransferase with HDIG domain
MDVWHDREKAYALLCKYTKTESLIRHALSVEAAMRAMARHFGEDERAYGVAGLLHDLDYEQYPQEHCAHNPRLLRENGYGEDFIRAVQSHGYLLRTDIEPMSTLEKSLYAVDELTGLVTACVYVRPSKSIMDLEVSSVKKKWKDKAFAAGCDREVIARGADMLGMTWQALCEIVIRGMREAAEALSLAGGAAAD